MAKKEVFSKSKLQEFRIGILEILKSVKGKGIALTKDAEEYTTEIIECLTDIAIRYEKSGFYQQVDEEELFQTVYETLLQSSNGNKDNFNGGFAMHAKMKIKEEVEFYLLKNSSFRNIEISYDAIDLIRRIMNIYQDLGSRLGRVPTIYELASKLDKKSSEIRDTLSIFNTIRWFNDNDLYNNNDSTYFYDFSADNDLNQVIVSFLEKTNLNGEELAIIFLHYGIVPHNSSIISYEDKTIFLDGIPKTLDEIGQILSKSGERIRQVKEAIFCKLEICDEIFTLKLIDYIDNPDLVLRLKDIYNWISSIPFTDKYPNFNSYFPEYNEQEIKDVLGELDINDLTFIRQLDCFYKDVIDFKYGVENSRILFKIIKNTYIKLINKYGRRSMKTNLTSCTIPKYGQYLDKLRNFYRIYAEYDKNMVLYLVTTLTEASRGTLFQAYGNDLSKILTPYEILKMDSRVLPKVSV